MAENYDNNDEYEFTDFDAIEPETMSMEEMEGQASTLEAKRQAELSRNNIKRNALIVLVVVIFLMLAYKFLGSFFSHKTTPAPATPVVTTPIQPVSEPQPTVATTPPVTETPPPTLSSAAEEQINQKIGAIELNQQNMSTEFNNVTEQVSGVNNNINELTNKINNLSQMVSDLAQKLEEQAHLVNQCTVKPIQPKPIVRPVVRVRVPRTVFYIQAIIPGRAWLIGSNGSTITVREGTNIAGYGVVRLIDPHQGRVLTSSGQIIKFNPQDS